MVLFLQLPLSGCVVKSCTDLIYSLVDLFQTQKLNAVDLLFAEKLSLLHQVWEPMDGLTLDILQFDLD